MSGRTSAAVGILLASAALIALASVPGMCYWSTDPEPIHVYMQYWDTSVDGWMPVDCPRPGTPRITISGSQIHLRAVAGFPTTCGTIDEASPWDNDTRFDPSVVPDIVICNWDFDDGTAGFFAGDVNNTQYDITYTFQNSGLHRVMMKAWDDAQEHAPLYGGTRQQGADDPDVVQYLEVCVGGDCSTQERPRIDRPLPDSGVNGPDRSNFKWADPDPNIVYGDDFTLPAGTQWVIDKLRVWAVPSIPVAGPPADPPQPGYHLGDHYKWIELIGGQGAGLWHPALGTFSTGSDVISTLSPPQVSITATPIAYQTGTSSGNPENYLAADGLQHQVWQIDFSNLNWTVNGGEECIFGIRGVPRYDRLWFNHAANFAGGESGADQKVRKIDATQFTEESVDLSPQGDILGWFGKGSDINVQVFAHPE